MGKENRISDFILNGLMIYPNTTRRPRLLQVGVVHCDNQQSETDMPNHDEGNVRSV